MPILILFAVLLVPSVCLAQEAPVTGLPVVDQVLAWVGALAGVLTFLATVLPRTWKVTQLLARFASDLRGILTPDTSDDPKWMKGKGAGLIVLLAAIGLSGCEKPRVDWPEVVKCLPGVNELLSLVGDALLGDGGWRQALEDLALKHGADAVVCAVKQVHLEWSDSASAVSPEDMTAEDVARYRALGRAEAFLDSVGAE